MATLNSIFNPTRTLPNQGGSYNIANSTPAQMITPAPVAPPTPMAPKKSKYIDPRTGTYFATPQEYANYVAQKLPVSKATGDVGQYAGDAITKPDQSVGQLKTTARGMMNTRNDIATGTTDPYKAGKDSGIAYSPSQLAAIEKAYAGIYDPVLNEVFAKIDAKEKKDAEDLAMKIAEQKATQEHKFELEKLAKQHQYALELKRTPSGDKSDSLFSGSSSPYKTDLDALIGRVPLIIESENGKEAFASSIRNSRDDGDKISAIATAVLRNSPMTVRTDFANQASAVKNIDKAIALINKGVQTGVLNNTKQYIYNVAGKDFDPNLTAISQYLISSIQPYRNSVTGAAWGEQEDAEYRTLFGSTKYSPAELKNRLLRVKEIMKDKTAVALNSQINPVDTGYNIFSGSQTSNQPNVIPNLPSGEQSKNPGSADNTFMQWLKENNLL